MLGVKKKRGFCCLGFFSSKGMEGRLETDEGWERLHCRKHQEQ